MAWAGLRSGCVWMYSDMRLFYLFIFLLFLPSTKRLRSCDSSESLCMLITLTLMQSVLARTHTHTLTMTEVLLASGWGRRSSSITYSHTHPHTHSPSQTHTRANVYKNWIAGACGSQSTYVFTSDGIWSLEASRMTQMFVGFGSRCCFAPWGVLFNTEALFLNKNREICISQTSWSAAGSRLSTGPDSEDGQDEGEDIIEMGSRVVSADLQ